VSEAFGDRLIHRVRELGHPLCVGLDPHLAKLPPLFRQGAMAPGDPETAEAVLSFCLAMLDRVEGRVAAVKPQSAFFEQLGPVGVAVLGSVMSEARRRGLLVILDAKRGDIGSTAEGYAAAYLAKDAPLRADALTVNPYLGMDTLEPFAAAAQEAGAGLFVLVKTSNPGSADLQDLPAPARPLYEHVAESLSPLAERLTGPETGWSSLGVVVGAPWPEPSQRIRQLLPRSPFLVPGYGAQGGGVHEAFAGFVEGPDASSEGGLINSSRAILFPPTANVSDAPTWERAIDTALTSTIEELSGDVR
jgi:orotidine-5'-phosphate decarboxylase